MDLGIGTQKQHRLGGSGGTAVVARTRRARAGRRQPPRHTAVDAFRPHDLAAARSRAGLPDLRCRPRTVPPARRSGTQTVGLVGFSALALRALFLDPAVGHYVVAAGWIGHAIWDIAHHRDLNHHRAAGVVPRWYAESCFVLDLLIGASLLVAPTL